LAKERRSSNRKGCHEEATILAEQKGYHIEGEKKRVGVDLTRKLKKKFSVRRGKGEGNKILVVWSEVGGQKKKKSGGKRNWDTDGGKHVFGGRQCECWGKK